MSRNEEFKRLVETLKLSVATLREHGIPFALGGGLAAWARGGPVTENDLDLMVKPDDAERALAALESAGMRPERPPEEWLYKAYDDDVLVDLIFRPSGLELTDEVFARGDVLAVSAVATPVLALEDVLVTMLCALDEHALDYSRLVAIARSLREQINWPQLRSRTVSSPFARAFFTLVEGLEIAPAAHPAERAPSSRIRVLSVGTRSTADQDPVAAGPDRESA